MTTRLEQIEQRLKAATPTVGERWNVDAPREGASPNDPLPVLILRRDHVIFLSHAYVDMTALLAVVRAAVAVDDSRRERVFAANGMQGVNAALDTLHEALAALLEEVPE